GAAEEGAARAVAVMLEDARVDAEPAAAGAAVRIAHHRVAGTGLAGRHAEIERGVVERRIDAGEAPRRDILARLLQPQVEAAIERAAARLHACHPAPEIGGRQSVEGEVHSRETGA